MEHTILSFRFIHSRSSDVVTDGSSIAPDRDRDNFFMAKLKQAKAGGVRTLIALVTFLHLPDVLNYLHNRQVTYNTYKENGDSYFEWNPWRIYQNLVSFYL